MADRRELARLPDADLEAALRDLGRSLAWPATSGTDDVAARARRRIVAEGIRPARRQAAGPRGLGWLPRPFRSSLGIAIAALLVIAAIAGAIGLGVPGIRLTPTTEPIVTPRPPVGPTPAPTGGGNPSPTASPGALGSSLGLGEPVRVDTAAALVPFPVRMPPDRVGAPETAWLLEGRLTFAWRGSAELPAIPGSSIGLLLTEFEGGVDPDYFEKILGPGTTVETVQVGESTGYWITGAPHELIYVDAHGNPVFDSRRIVGDTLLWADGSITYRLEAGLSKADAVALGESLR
jgi:hypothetical protein